jgi:hypothetical protein
MATSPKLAQKRADQPTLTPESSLAMLDPNEIIEAMIDLRLQLREVERQIQALQPSFYAACALLNMEKIALQRAVITRRLTPGQWDYSVEILEQEALFKQLKQEFQELHEPNNGRDVYWMIRLLVTLA